MQVHWIMAQPQMVPGSVAAEQVTNGVKVCRASST